MTSTSTFLADRLSELESEALVDLGVYAGVDMKTARRAASGQHIPARAAFLLYAAIGYDPITQKRRAPQRVGKFNHNTLGLFMVARMMRPKITARVVAEVMGVSTRVVDAIREARPVSAGNVVKACVYLDIHPFEQCERLRGVA